MNNLMRTGLLAGLFFLLQFSVNAQFTGSLPVVQATPGSQVTIPVQVSQMTGVQAFNIGIRFNAAVLTFGSVNLNGHPLQGTLTQTNLVGNELRVVYVGNALNVSNDTLFEVVFTYSGSGGVSQLLWNREYTEFTGANSTLLTESLTNGVLYASGVAAAISANTGDATACELGGTSLGVTATNATAFQWQVSTDGGATFSNLSNATGVSGATTATLSLSNLAQSANNNYYQCIVSGTGGNALSRAQRLSVSAVSGVGVTVQAQPAGAQCAGTSVTYSATLGSTVNAPQYVWKVNGQQVGTSATFVSAGLTNGDQVSVDVTSGTSCVSGSASLQAQVSALPTTFTTSGGGSYCAGGTGVQISLSGSQSGVTYRLLRNSVVVDSLTGTGNAIQFQNRTDSGSYTITAISTSGCTQQMTGSATVSINALPNAEAGNDATIFVGNSTQLLASGGTSYAWSPSTGLSATNVANPIASPQQTTRYFVTVSNLFGCSRIDSVLITVNQLPVVTVGNDTAVCISGTTFTLRGSPTGGSWSGSGIVSASAGTFSPSLAGTGSKTLVYTVTDGVNYTITDTLIVTVNPLPVVDFGDPGSFCINGASVTLTTGTPAGGTYSGTGVSNGQFNPQTAGVGSHTLYYNFTSPQTGCSNLDSVVVTVSNLPQVNLDNFQPVCLNGDSVELAGGTPLGGSYSGPGVRNGYFFPATAGVGTHFIRYTYTNPQTGCSNVDSGSITVRQLPVLSFPTLSAVCVNNAGFALSTATPAGGTYSGPGVNNNEFLPQLAGIGTFTITYTYVDTLTGCRNSITSSILVNDVPVVTLGSFNAVCVSAPAFALSGGNPAGGTFSGPGVSNGQFNPFAAGPGTHAIVYSFTDAQTGCVGSATRNMVVTPGPSTTLTALNSTTFCIGGSVVLQASADTGSSFVWLRNGQVLTGETAATLTVNQSGSYRVLGTKTSTGCSDTSLAVTVTVNPLPGATITAVGLTTFCQGGSVVLNATPATGMSYVWLRNGTVVTGQTTASLTAMQAGDYRVIVTNTSTQCFDTSAVTNVTVNPLPGAAITAVGATTFCQGGSVVLNATPATGMNYVWLRNGVVVTGQTTASLTANQAGAYRVLVTNTSTQCFDTSAVTNVTVNPLPGAAITAVGATTFCQGGSVVLNATPATGMSYVWLRNGVVVTGQTTASLTANQAGAYRVLVTNTSTQCFDTSAVTNVTVNPLPGAAITAVGSTTFCQGGSVVLNATPATGMSYVWLRNGVVVTGQTTASLTATQAGAYRVLVTNTSTQCFDTSAVTTITVNPLPTATITPASSTTICDGGSVVLNANTGTGLTYAWLRNGAVVAGQTTASLTATQAGAYRVIVTNASSCFDTSVSTTVTVNPRPATPTITVNPTSDTLRSNSATGNQWFRNGVAIAGATNQTLVITQNGSYRATVTNTNGCVSDSSNVLNVLNVSVAGQSFSYLNLYPNPTSGKAWLQVELPLFEEVRIEVLSSTGQRVHFEWLAASTGALQHELQLPALADGVYLIRVQQGEYVGLKRLMVRK